MSADAKVWPASTGWMWEGLHDGPCDHSSHRQGEFLALLLADIEHCLGQSLRWEIVQTGNGPALYGYLV